MTDDSVVCFSQYAQDPLEGFEEDYPELCKHDKSSTTCVPRSTSRKSKPRRDNSKKKMQLQGKSFVITRETEKGTRLIKIKVIDITMSPPQLNSEANSDSDSNVILRAQYVVKDHNDDILAQTESVIHKISKKLCDSYYV